MFRGSYLFCMVLISVMVLGLLFGSRGSDENERVREALFPELKFNQTDVSRIEIYGSRLGSGVGVRIDTDAGAGEEAQVTLILEDGLWRVQELLDSPADSLKVNRFVQALIEAEKLERKTFTQANYYRVGVDDSATGVSLGGQVTIWVGNSATTRSGRYVRMLEGDENAVWLISSGLTELSSNPEDWLVGDEDIP